MKAELDAVRQLLVPYTGAENIEVYFGDVPGEPTYPYVLLWCSPGLLEAVEADGAQDDLNEPLGVTYVAETSDAVLVVADRCRKLLVGAQPTAAGRYVQPLRLEDSRAVRADEAWTLPNTDRHPAYAVDIYRLRSEALPTP